MQKAERPLRVLHVNTTDAGGGAERVAHDLAAGLCRMGHEAALVVGRRRAADGGEGGALVIELTDPAKTVWQAALHRLESFLAQLAGRVPGAGRASTWLRRLARRQRLADWWHGRECFDWPGSRRLLAEVERRVDLVHIHNLHGDYFDLTLLPELCRRVPVVVTLHDEWMMTGHCSFTRGCERLFSGCGRCPDLSIYPAVRRDATAENWQRKQAIYAACNLAVVSPSSWLLERARASILAPAVQHWATIANGVDIERFQPGERERARRRLGLPLDGAVLLFAASGGRKNRSKDIETARRTAVELARRRRDRASPPVFVLLGATGPVQTTEGVVEWPLRLPPESDLLPDVFRAADLYLHAAHAENFPLAVLEALATGLPVVATAVGGIVDQVPGLAELSTDAVSGVSQTEAAGVLVDRGDWSRMADAVEALLDDDGLRRRLAANARHLAEEAYGADRQLQAHLDLYRSFRRMWREHAAGEGWQGPGHGGEKSQQA